MLYEWCLDLTGQSVSRYNNAPVPATTQRGVYFPEHVKYHTCRKSASVLFQHTLKATLQSNDTKTKKKRFFVDYFLNKIAFNRRNFFVRENRIESRKNFKPTFIIFFCKLRNPYYCHCHYYSRSKASNATARCRSPTWLQFLGGP